MSAIPVITELDAARIRELGSRLPRSTPPPQALSQLIDMIRGEAEIVPGARVPPDVVTVNSRVTFREEVTGTVHTVTVVYPHDFSIAQGCISLLSPVGLALLGRRVGDIAALEMPDGRTRHIRLLELHYQPEASGDLTR
jgi:regulator of nucleoside diphosphate kinase